MASDDVPVWLREERKSYERRIAEREEALAAFAVRLNEEAGSLAAKYMDAEARAAEAMQALGAATDIIVRGNVENALLREWGEALRREWDACQELLEVALRDKASAEAERDEARALVRSAPLGAPQAIIVEAWLQRVLAAIERWGSR